MALLLVGLVFVLVSVGCAEATTYFARTSGGTTTQCTGTTNANYPGSGTGQACAYADLQDALTAATFGDTVKLHAGDTFSPANGSTSFNLANKGTAPTGTDADYITVTTDDTSGTPLGLSMYPGSRTRITTAMAATMPTVRTIGSVPALLFANSSKYWKIERLNITNQDTGSQAIRLIGQDDPTTLAHYPNRVIIQLNWIHPIEETGTVLSAGNVSRTAENAIYLQGTNLTFRQNAMQGFAGRNKYGGEAGNRMTSSNILIGTYADTVTIENNLLEAWTYAVFVGGSGVPDYLVTSGGTVSGCAGNPATSCVFSNTTGLSAGDPVSVYVSTSSSGNKWGAAFVDTIVSGTVTFVDPLCQSFDGGNSCTAQNGTPADGDAARWNGLLPSAITVRQNVFAHYPEWSTELDECGGKGYLEVKSCIDCTFDGNTFMGCSGPTVTVRNQNGDFPWVSLDRLTFSNNYWMNSNQPFTGFFTDAIPTRRSTGITWTNNLYLGLSTHTGLSGGTLSGNFQGGDNVTITHNTVMWSKTASSALGSPGANNYRAFTSFVPRPMAGLIVRDNLLGAAGNTCFVDLGGSSGTSITDCWPSATVNHNVLVNTDGYDASDMNASWFTPYPSNTLLTSVASVGFTNATSTLESSGNYRLLSSSAYHNAASDGADIGVDYPALVSALGYDPNAGVKHSGGIKHGPGVKIRGGS